MLCAKCQKNDATIHVTTVVGTEQETVDFCRNCAPPSLAGLDHEKAMAEARSILEKKCEFCGTTAYSKHMLAGGAAIYLCFDCDTELMSIVMELLKTERPDLMPRSKEAVSFLSPGGNANFQGWSQASQATRRKSVQILRERRRQDGRDKQS
jgi:hypothetical protein